MTGGPRSGAELDPMNQPRAGTTSMLESLLPALGAWLPRSAGSRRRTARSPASASSATRRSPPRTPCPPWRTP